jgi:hypothetical protein
LVITFNSCLSCSDDDPLLMMSLTCSISVLRLFRVLLEAKSELTLGVVTLTMEIGC